jgi:hypothetical protein
MDNLQTIVTATNFSQVSFTDSIISDNDIPNNTGWIGFEALSDSFMGIGNVTLERNTGVEFVASARGGSFIILDLVEIIDTTATPTPVSI